MAELDEAEKNRISHRARAFLALAEAIRSHLGPGSSAAC
jgi:inosine/xanthosine triphosphate pyrophosphatase family protein